MTLEVLRQKVGSHDFFVILRKWAQQNAYGTAWLRPLSVIQPRFVKVSARWDF